MPTKETPAIPSSRIGPLDRIESHDVDAIMAAITLFLDTTERQLAVYPFEDPHSTPPLTVIKAHLSSFHADPRQARLLLANVVMQLIWAEEAAEDGDEARARVHLDDAMTTVIEAVVCDSMLVQHAIEMYHNDREASNHE